MVVSDREPSNKRRRCLIGEERVHDGEDDEVQKQVHVHNNNQRPKPKVCTVYIGGLHPRIVEAHLEKMCMPYGSIQRLHLCDRKGYAFCQYATPEQAEAAMQALDGRGLLGRRLMVRPAHNDSQHNHNSGNNYNNTGGRASASAAAATWQSNSNENTNTNPDKERERIESRIQAVKRKLQDSKPSSV